MRETAGERTGCRASVTTAASTPRSSRARCKFGPQPFTSASITLSVRRRVRELRDARQRRTPACAVCVRRIRVTFVSGEAGERRPPSDDTRRFADTRCDAVGSWRLLEDKQPFLLTARGRREFWRQPQKQHWEGEEQLPVLEMYDWISDNHTCLRNTHEG